MSVRNLSWKVTWKFDLIYFFGWWVGGEWGCGLVTGESGIKANLSLSLSWSWVEFRLSLVIVTLFFFTKIYFGPKLFQTKFFWGHNYFCDQTFFGDQNFWGIKIFLLQNYYGTKVIVWSTFYEHFLETIILFGPTLFQTIFLRQIWKKRFRTKDFKTKLSFLVQPINKP